MSGHLADTREAGGRAGARRAAAPFFLAAALMFWGWQAGFLLQTALMAVALEALSLGGARLEIRPKDFSRVLDLCVVVFLAVTVYLYLTPSEQRLLLVMVVWLPFALFPLALAESASNQGEVALSGVFYTLRRKRKLAGKEPRRMRFAPVFGMACVFAAGAANERSGYFFLGASLLLCWWLAWRRPGRYPLAVWLVSALLAVLVGWGGQWSIEAVQQAVRDWVREDPFKRSTAIGEIGELKFSDEIVLRVAAGKDVELPLLLRENTYNFFDGRQWTSSGAQFQSLQPVEQGNWQLRDYNTVGRNEASGNTARRSVTIYQYFYRRGGLIFLPEGAGQVLNLPVAKLEQSQLGAVRAAGAPGLAGYTVRYTPGASLESPPTAVEQVVPRDREIIETLLKDLGLEGMTPMERALAIRDYLRTRFEYSLTLERTRTELSPLQEFLLHSRKGHCEYFALAAVFMLRTAGIPSRYAVGYSVQEYSPEEDLLIVRERHGHSWALAWIGGEWLPLDATPPVWFELESGGESWLQPLADLRQRLSFAFARWRWLGEDARLKRILLWTVGPLLLFLLYRLGRKMRFGRSARKAGGGREFGFGKVEQLLARRGFSRGASEPWGAFLSRAGEPDLGEALSLYYRARFDPLGLDNAGRQALREKVRAWLRAAKNRSTARS